MQLVFDFSQWLISPRQGVVQPYITCYFWKRVS